MISNSFTYIISSYNAENNATANNCNIRLSGLPHNTYFQCEVLGFHLDTSTIETDTGVEPNAFTNSYLTLVADNFISNGKMTGSKMLDEITSMNFYDGSSTEGSVFVVENFNGKTVNFQLVNPKGEVLSDDAMNAGGTTVWKLTLKMTPIENDI